MSENSENESIFTPFKPKKNPAPVSRQASPSSFPQPQPADNGRVSALEKELHELRTQVMELKVSAQKPSTQAAEQAENTAFRQRLEDSEKLVQVLAARLAEHESLLSAAQGKISEELNLKLGIHAQRTDKAVSLSQANEASIAKVMAGVEDIQRKFTVALAKTALDLDPKLAGYDNKLIAGFEDMQRKLALFLAKAGEDLDAKLAICDRKIDKTSSIRQANEAALREMLSGLEEVQRKFSLSLIKSGEELDSKLAAYDRKTLSAIEDTRRKLSLEVAKAAEDLEAKLSVFNTKTDKTGSMVQSNEASIGEILSGLDDLQRKFAFSLEKTREELDMKLSEFGQKTEKAVCLTQAAELAVTKTAAGFEDLQNKLTAAFAKTTDEVSLKLSAQERKLDQAISVSKANELATEKKIAIFENAYNRLSLSLAQTSEDLLGKLAEYDQKISVAVANGQQSGLDVGNMLERFEEIRRKIPLSVVTTGENFDAKLEAYDHKLEQVTATTRENEASIAKTLAEFEDLQRKFASYAADFTAIERECRTSLGTIKGYVQTAGKFPLSEKYDEYLKDSITRLTAKQAAAEIALHESVAKLAGRLNGNEALYGKMFSDAEQRLKMAMAPELKQLEARIADVNNDAAWLKDEFKMVVSLKIKALEGKYSAFEAMSAHLKILTEDIRDKGSSSK